MNHRGTPEAEAAEFYSATLAWRARKWTEAATLHKAFAAAHPDSPLARVALDERLPAIAKKSLAVPLHDPVDRTVRVEVFPGARKRKAIPITKTTAYNAHLDIVPVNGYVLVDSDIIDRDSRGVAILWTGPNPKTPTLRRFHLCAAFSSQEYVMIEGTLAKPGPGGGGGGKLPEFRVTVPSVDVDWVGFTDPADESGEETRFVIVPLNTNKVDDIRRILINDPFDDDERNKRPPFPYGHPVNPDVTLHWEAGNTLGLLDGQRTFANGTNINVQATTWPLDFTVTPLLPAVTFKIYVKGQADNVTGEKAVDNIRGRVVNVDLDVDSDYDGKIDVADEPLEETRGGLVCVCSNSLRAINLKLEPANLPGKLTLSATAAAGGGGIRVWENGAPILLPKTWPANAYPATLFVEGTNASATARDVELRLEYDENPVGLDNPLFKCADTIRLTVIKVDLVARRPYTEGPNFWNPFGEHEVPEDKEESPGAGIRVNGDTDSAVNENDLIKIELKVKPFPMPSGLTYVLKRSSSNIEVWGNKQGTGTAILDSGTEASVTFSVATTTVWVENPSGGAADLELIARSGTTDVCSDKVHFYPFTSVVIAFGGRNQVPSDPPDANSSGFVIATNLYQNGYDVHMYDEENSADAMTEVDLAIANRSVTEVAVFGYSWGGDAAFDVVDHLNGNPNSFTIRYTAYIDAVNNPYNPLHVSQDQRPVNTLWHANYYQRAAYSILNLRGDAIVNPPGANTETNLTAAGVTHVNVDDLGVVRNGVFNGVITHVDR